MPKIKPADPTAEHPFVTSKDVQDLRDVMRALNGTMTALLVLERKRAEERLLERQDQKTFQTQLLEAVNKIADHTANQPALMAVLMAKATNGGAHGVVEGTEP